jgi:hypothetical protein
VSSVKFSCSQSSSESFEDNCTIVSLVQRAGASAGCNFAAFGVEKPNPVVLDHKGDVVSQSSAFRDHVGESAPVWRRVRKVEECSHRQALIRAHARNGRAVLTLGNRFVTADVFLRFL